MIEKCLRKCIDCEKYVATQCHSSIFAIPSTNKWVSSNTVVVATSYLDVKRIQVMLIAGLVGILKYVCSFTHIFCEKNATKSLFSISSTTILFIYMYNCIIHQGKNRYIINFIHQCTRPL